MLLFRNRADLSVMRGQIGTIRLYEGNQFKDIEDFEDWAPENKEEFRITGNAHKIRIDHVVHLYLIKCSLLLSCSKIILLFLPCKRNKPYRQKCFFTQCIFLFGDQNKVLG